MENKDILKAMEFRISSLKETIACIEKESGLSEVTELMATRLDEIESLYNWAKGEE